MNDLFKAIAQKRLTEDTVHVQFCSDWLKGEIIFLFSQLTAAQEKLRVAEEAIVKMWDHGCHVGNCRVRTKSLTNVFCTGHQAGLDALAKIRGEK